MNGLTNDADLRAEHLTRLAMSVNGIGPDDYTRDRLFHMPPRDSQAVHEAAHQYAMLMLQLAVAHDPRR